jgi:FtsZ-interacting cell division protein YlmF
VIISSQLVCNAVRCLRQDKLHERCSDSIHSRTGHNTQVGYLDGFSSNRPSFLKADRFWRKRSYQSPEPKSHHVCRKLHYRQPQPSLIESWFSKVIFHRASRYYLETIKITNYCELFSKFTSIKVKIVKIFRKTVFLLYLIIRFRVKLSLISTRAVTVSFLSKLKDIVSLNDQDDSEYEDVKQYSHGYDAYKADVVKSSDDNIVSMSGAACITSSVVLIEPHAFEEMPQFLDALRQQKSVILNTALVRQEEAQRALDFAAGGTYAIDGHYECIGDNIFLFTPSCVQVTTPNNVFNEIVQVSNRPSVTPKISWANEAIAQ